MRSVVPLAGHGLRPAALRRRASRPQLKRDPLGSPATRLFDSATHPLKMGLALRSAGSHPLSMPATLKRVFVVSLGLLLGSCNKPFWTPRPPGPVALRPHDPRARVVGVWTIELQLDSARDQPMANPAVTVRGTAILKDTVV